MVRMLPGYVSRARNCQTVKSYLSEILAHHVSQYRQPTSTRPVVSTCNTVFRQEDCGYLFSQFLRDSDCLCCQFSTPIPVATKEEYKLASLTLHPPRRRQVRYFVPHTADLNHR